jgi:GTP-binding protein Era
MVAEATGAGAGGRARQQRFGFVAVIGAPNAGKSTLVNALVGSKVSIVSRKVQTTRMPVRGIVISGDSQIVLVDMPGIFQPRRRLDRAMVTAAWGGAAEADIVALIVDAAKGLAPDVEAILAKLGDVRAPKFLVLNKVDRVADKAKLLALTQQINERVRFDEVLMISALEGSGVEDLKTMLARAVPPGPWHYAEDDITDMPMRLLAAEITREKVFDTLHDELPYSISVETSAWKELKDRSVRIEQTIFVERDSQKKIVIGKGGQTIKQISLRARAEIGELIEQGVHLFLFVKVREGWGDDPERFRELGLEFPRDT